MKKKKVGRPTIMTKDVIAKLEIAFSHGATDKEAIFIAEISKDAFYDYCKLNPSFTERIEGLRDLPKYTAKSNIIKKINTGSIFESEWWLERKAKDEFSTRNEMTGKNGDAIEVKTITGMQIIKDNGNTV